MCSLQKLGFLCSLWFVAAAGAAAQNIPWGLQTECTISMESWCIATGGVASMTDDGEKRVWTLGQFGKPKDSFVILEDDNCFTLEVAKPRKTSDGVSNGADGERTRIVRYALNETGTCSLEFRFPHETVEDGKISGYETLMRYSILVGGRPLGDFGAE